MRKRKGQFGSLITGALGISILGLVLVMAVVFNAEVSNLSVVSADTNATAVIADVNTGLLNFASFTPLIVIAIVFVVIIGLLLLVVRRTGGGL